MSKKLRDVAARFRGRIDEVLAGDSWGGFEFSLFYPGGDEGIFFLKLTRESEGLTITHDTPATIFGVRSKEGLADLSGTTHQCQERDGSALCFEVSDDDYSFTFFVFCTTRLVRILSLDKKTVRVQVELDVRADPPVHFSGGERYGDRIGEEGPPAQARTLVLEAVGSFADFQKEHAKFFKSLTALKAFPVKDLRVARMDPLKLGGSVPAWEVGFEELSLRGALSRPYLVMQRSPLLPDVAVAELAGLEMEQNGVHGQVYDLYKGGRPFAELVKLSFGEVKGKNLECTMELHLRLAEAAHHNPDHRYKDATAKLKTRIPLATGFA